MATSGFAEAMVSLCEKGLKIIRTFIYRDHIGIIAVIKRNQEIDMAKALRIDFSQYGYILIIPVIEDYDQTGLGHRVGKCSN
jgi:hypothetical protein